MANLFKMEVGRWNAFMGKLAEAGFTAEMCEEVLKNPAFAAKMVAALTSPADYSWVSGLFISPQDQLAQVRAWNEEYGWGFTDGELHGAAESHILRRSADRLTTLVLVPYFGDFWTTFCKLWELARSRQERYSVSWGGFSGLPEENLRLLPGITHPGKCLRWEKIDLGAIRGCSPGRVRDPKTSPHAGILAAAALHPNWVRAMDGDFVPRVWLPGYQVTIPCYTEWAYVPVLNFNSRSREVSLHDGWYDEVTEAFGVPVLR